MAFETRDLAWDNSLRARGRTRDAQFDHEPTPP
jgi:hypothetical protein